MRSVMKIVAILAFLGSRGAVVQSAEPARSSAGSVSTGVGPLLAQNTSRVFEAPVGHRQPRPHDVPSQSPGELERRNAEDAAFDRKLVICRGC